MTNELCCDCGAETGRAGRLDDSLYAGNFGPYCEDCWSYVPDELAAIVESQNKTIAGLNGFIRDFATATFNTLPRPFIADPQDRPDDATDIAAVLAWQDDAQDLLKGAKP